MRFKGLILLLTSSLLALILLPPHGGTQQPGGKKAKVGPKVDFYELFYFLAKGRDHFVISETSDLRDSLLKFARAQGISDGKMTREQFEAWAVEFASKLAAEGVGVDTKILMATIAAGDKGKPGEGIKPEIWGPQAEWEFNRRDGNGDKKLSRDEMSGNLRDSLARWDANKDNLIDFNEFKTYYFDMIQAKAQRWGQPKGEQKKSSSGNGPPSTSGTPNGGTPSNGTAGSNGTTTVDLDDLDARPLVYRADNLPKGLPPWFEECDEDRDCQVSLFEWRKKGRSLDEFQAMDCNDDGLLTIEEVLRYQKENNHTNGKGSN